MLFSKSWANWLLKNVIKELNNVRRPEFSRIHEVVYSIRLLEREGFFWQVERIRNHWHLAIKRGNLHAKHDLFNKKEGGIL